MASLERHGWIYEIPFYTELIEKAKFTNPTPMSYDGERITIQHACINRALLPCVLLETYSALTCWSAPTGRWNSSPVHSLSWVWPGQIRSAW